MKYRIEQWSLIDLVSAYRSEALNLNPPYQRQFIWSKKDQQTLLRSILSGIAIPNIFVQELQPNRYSMVDGQQRTRTVLAFVNQELSTFEGHKYSPRVHDDILSTYFIPVTIITKLETDETIEGFYALVNSSGIHLNRPELKTAEYFETRFMRLIKELADNDDFVKLNLFSEQTTKRMTDEDFTSELLAQLFFGITDKKNAVNRLYEKDVTPKQATQLRREFKRVLSVFVKLNNLHPIRKTRYKQRNDFYTLFGFVHQIISKPIALHKYIYELLVLMDPNILPSNDKCDPFQQYAFHCISQSNSKVARDERHNILSSLFLNEGKDPSSKQKQVLKFYELDSDDMVRKHGYLMFNISAVTKRKQEIVP